MTGEVGRFFFFPLRHTYDQILSLSLVCYLARSYDIRDHGVEQDFHTTVFHGIHST